MAIQIPVNNRKLPNIFETKHKSADNNGKNLLHTQVKNNELWRRIHGNAYTLNSGSWLQTKTKKLQHTH